MGLLQNKPTEAQAQPPLMPKLVLDLASPFMKPAGQTRFEATVQKIYMKKPQVAAQVIHKFEKMRAAFGEPAEMFYGETGLAWGTAHKLFMTAAKANSVQTALKTIINPAIDRIERLRQNPSRVSRGLPLARESMDSLTAGMAATETGFLRPTAPSETVLPPQKAAETKGMHRAQQCESYAASAAFKLMQNTLLRLDRVYTLLGGLEGQPYSQKRYKSLSDLVGTDTAKSWGIGDFNIRLDCSGTATALLILSGVSIDPGTTSDYYNSLRKNPNHARSADYVRNHDGVYVWATRGHVAFAISDGMGSVYWNEAHQPGMAYTTWGNPGNERRGTYLEFGRG